MSVFPEEGNSKREDEKNIRRRNERTGYTQELRVSNTNLQPIIPQGRHWIQSIYFHVAKLKHPRYLVTHSFISNLMTILERCYDSSTFQSLSRSASDMKWLHFQFSILIHDRINFILSHSLLLYGSWLSKHLGTLNIANTLEEAKFHLLKSML